MLLSVFYYLVAALLLCQGLHACGEQLHPLGVVPQEVALSREKGIFWGFLLMGIGTLAILAGLGSHVWPEWQRALWPLLLVALAAMGAYGLFVIFGSRKVIYQAQVQGVHHGHHH